MVKFGRRERSAQEATNTLFADADSVSGISEGVARPTGNTFSARIIVSDGTTNTCVTEVQDTHTDSILDTTFGLENDLSVTSSGEGNELVIITNADGLDETSSDEESPIEVTNREFSAEKKERKVDRLFIIFVVVIIILFVVLVVLAIVFFVADRGDENDAQKFDADASFQVISTVEPGTFYPSEITATADPSEFYVETMSPTGSPTIITSAPTEKETSLPTSSPTVAPTSRVPTPQPTDGSTVGSTAAPTPSPTAKATPDPTLGSTAGPSASPTTEDLPFPVPAVASFSVVPTPSPTVSSTPEDQTQ